MTRRQLHMAMEGNEVGTYDQATGAIEFVMDLLDLQLAQALHAKHKDVRGILLLEASRKQVRLLLGATEPVMLPEE